MNLADNLKRIRKDNNLSQEQLAEKLGVSRQSVSKWESNQAYPEMDKVLQICQMFNLNIDDLLNQDIKEVNSNKQSKNNINKFIDDFLDFITKTIDMFSSMKFKGKIKCLIEQILIGGILALIFVIIGAIGSSVLQNVIMFLPEQIYFIIFNFIESLYFCVCFILIIVLLLYIFKVRYLDYYVFVKNDKPESMKDSNKKEIVFGEKASQKIILEKKPEKIVIRDPKHSGYKFISCLVSGLLFFLKFLAVLISVGFCLSLIFFFIVLVISFLFIKTGLIFIGSLLVISSCIIVNLVALVILYNFIISKKNKKSKLAIFFIISMMLIGLGIGFISIGITDFNYIDDINSEYFIEDELNVKMQDNLFIQDYYARIEFIESTNQDLKIVYKHSELFDIEMNDLGNNGLCFYTYPVNNNFMEIIRKNISDINNKKLIDYSNYKIYIYTTKENIDKLESNLRAYEFAINKSELEETISQYEREIDTLYYELSLKEERINELEALLEDY